MKARKWFTRLFAGSLSAALLCTSALGATSYDSPTMNFSVGNQPYECWSMLTVDGSRFDASSFIATADHATLTAGAVAVQARLCNASGSLIKSSNKVQSNNGDWFVMAYTGRYGSPEGAAFSQGFVYVGSSFQIITEATNTYAAALSANALPELPETYSITADGTTYGSSLMADTIGRDPDLILAENGDGVTGYVRSADLNDPDCGDAIPLYDLNGTVLGEFDIDPVPEYEDLPADVQAVLDRLAYEYENGIGLYPVNSKGETYGANTLGYQPDLIAAVGDGNVEGYVRTTELEAVTVTGISAVPSFHKIPLCDCEGNEIGTFTMTNGVMSASELQAALSRH